MKDKNCLKRYIVSVGIVVNKHASKTGVRYSYIGRTDDLEECIKMYSGIFECGFRIKDSETGKIVYKE
jgi:hypothetical protein